tara:strand:+ start:228 stop:413 length:186 start_codon:yes stop_codon:yes gene_type:complete
MISRYLNDIGKKSKIAAKNLLKIDVKKRNRVLETYSKELKRNKKKLLKKILEILNLVKDQI